MRMRHAVNLPIHLERDPPAPLADAVRAEQIRLLFGAPAITLINLVNAPLVAAVLWSVYPHWSLLAWIGLHVAVIVGRGVLWRRFLSARPSARDAGAWGVAFTVGAALTGVLWGMLGSVVFIADDPLHLVFATFMLGGMTAGSAIRDSAYPPAFLGFAIPAVAPMIVALAVKGGPFFLTMAFLLIAFSGALMLIGRRNGQWIAENVGLRLQQVTLNEQLRQASEQMADNLKVMDGHQRAVASIARLSDFLQACQTRDEAYPIIALAAERQFPESSGAISLLSSETGQLETVIRWGHAPNVAAAFVVTDCWALRTGQRYEVPDPKTAPCCAHFETPPRHGYICLPLSVQGETMGLLHLSSQADRSIDEDMRAQIVTFGDVVKLSLSNLKLRERLSDQALRDQLTSLFNRHYLSETLPREIRRARRDRTALTVAIADIDNFKALNDAYGHAAGDAVLRDLGAFLSASLRGGDIACRYGGEEFLLVLTECDREDARKRLSHICEDLKLLPFAVGAQALPQMSLSVGLAQLSNDVGTMEALIAAADQALYLAKQTGRDRIETYLGDGDGPAAPVQARPGAPRRRKAPVRRAVRSA